jgi:formate dehydrogenase accessory protein FdhE
MLSRFQGFDSSIIRQTMATRPLYIEKVIAHLIEKKTKNLHNLANNAGMQFDDFMFLMINWLKPVFLALRDKYPANGVVEHDGGTCPFCGYYPDMGISIAGAREDRYLRCGLCETLWKTAELSCPACGESSAEKLENFMAGDGRFMAEACHSCGGYIKMLLAEDPGSLADLDLTVESLSSISFDEMMQRKGFNRQ